MGAGSETREERFENGAPLSIFLRWRSGLNYANLRVHTSYENRKRMKELSGTCDRERCAGGRRLFTV